MKLDFQTICDLKATILDLLDQTDDIAEMEDYWHLLDRPDYPVEDLRRLDINIFDGEMYGNEPGYRAVVYRVDDGLNIVYDDFARIGFPDLPDHLKELCVNQDQWLEFFVTQLYKEVKR